jgi:hypothetical protein
VAAHLEEVFTSNRRRSGSPLPLALASLAQVLLNNNKYSLVITPIKLRPRWRSSTLAADSFSTRTVVITARTEEEEAHITGANLASINARAGKFDSPTSKRFNFFRLKNRQKLEILS